MGYKTVMTVATENARAARSVEQAAALAEGLDAHLEVLALGVDRTQAGYYYAGANAMVLQESIDRAVTESRALAKQMRAVLERGTVRWTLDEGVAQLADIGRHVAARARFADLLVLQKPYGDDAGIELEPVLEGALFEGGAPVILLPETGDVPAAPARIAIAWNESPEALRAIRAALPLLKGAEAVHVVVIDPPVHGPERSDPGGQLAQWLARHGVKPEIDVLSRTMPRIADVLARHVSDVGAEMVVMGAYGHSRFREAILGGATRDMLGRATVPVFMAH